MKTYWVLRSKVIDEIECTRCEKDQWGSYTHLTSAAGREMSVHPADLFETLEGATEEFEKRLRRRLERAQAALGKAEEAVRAFETKGVKARRVK
jgi:hypothetical protein